MKQYPEWRRKRLAQMILGSAVSVLTFAPTSRAADTVCTNLPDMDHPHVTISNGKVDAVVMLPDKDNGFNRGARFDWSGIVLCASLNGHKFFGEYSRYNPKYGSAVGPAEEFRVPDSPLEHTGPKGELFVKPGAILYNEAKPGDPFFKPGVGVLTRIDDKDYSYGVNYPIVDVGTWTNSHTPTSVTSKQVLKGPGGYAYEYEKVVSLDKNGTTLSITHHLKNTGSKAIDTMVYNHDFFMFDNQPTGAGIEVRFPWKLDASDLQGSIAKVRGNDIVFSDPIPPAAGAPRGEGGAQGYLMGFSDKVSDFDFTVENVKTGVGVQETSDTPLARLYFWSQARVVCPEGYIHVSVPPGSTQSWTLHYRLFAPPVPKT